MLAVGHNLNGPCLRIPSLKLLVTAECCTKHVLLDKAAAVRASYLSHTESGLAL